jgi:hypothetical protein
MSREEANRLCSLRREEIRKNQQLENNRLLRIKTIFKVSRSLYDFFLISMNLILQRELRFEFLIACVC